MSDREQVTVSWTKSLELDDVYLAAVELDGERHVRRFHPFDDEAVQDLRIARMYWRHADRAFGIGQDKAALVNQCLAIERLFPHLRERLPA